MSLKSKIEDITGSIGDDSALAQWISDGVVEIINVLPGTLKLKCTTETTLSNSPETMDMDGIGEILFVTRLSADSSGFRVPCREIPPMFGGLTEISSGHMMYEPSVTDPVYWIWSSNDATILNVRPIPTENQTAIVYHVQYPGFTTSGAGTYDITSTNSIANFPDEAEYLVLLYAAMRGLQRRLSDKSSSLPSDLVAPIREIISFNIQQNPPTFVAPTAFAMPTLPSSVNIDFTDVPTPPSFLSQSFSEPSYPTFDSMNLPAPPIAPTLDNPSVGTLPTAPTYIPPVMSLDFDDASTNWLVEEEDSEMVRSRIEIIQAQIQEFQARSADELNRYNKEKAVYDVEFNKVIQDSKFDSEDEARKLTKFQGEIQNYNTEVNKEVGRWTNEEYNVKLQEWMTKYGNRLQEFTNKVTEENARNAAEMAIFTKQISKAIETYKSETGYDLTRFQADVQAEVGRVQSDLTLASEQFKSGITKMDLTLRTLTESNQASIAHFGAEIQNYASKIDKQNVDYKWMQSQYIQTKEDYLRGLQLLATGDTGKVAPKQNPQQQQAPQQGGY